VIKTLVPFMPCDIAINTSWWSPCKVVFCHRRWFHRCSRYDFFLLAPSLYEILALLNRNFLFSNYLLLDHLCFMKLLYMWSLQFPNPFMCNNSFIKAISWPLMILSHRIETYSIDVTRSRFPGCITSCWPYISALVTTFVVVIRPIA